VKPDSGELVFVPAKLVRVIGDFDASALKVYLCLRAAAAGGSQVTDLTIETLAKATKLSGRMVLKALKRLDTGGWISRTPRPGRLSNRYSFR
jgi:MarR-like DNA-binding transcriptional regulator SgrR of sgrS sRNA